MHGACEKHTCGMIFFSMASLKRGGGGRSRPSIKNGTLDVSVTMPSAVPTTELESPFSSSPSSLFSIICFLWTSLTTSSSPCRNNDSMWPGKLLKWYQLCCWCPEKLTWKQSCIMLLFFFFELFSFACNVFKSHDINSTGSDCTPIWNLLLLAFITACKNSWGLTWTEKKRLCYLFTDLCWCKGIAQNMLWTDLTNKPAPWSS